MQMLVSDSEDRRKIKFFFRDVSLTVSNLKCTLIKTNSSRFYCKPQEKSTKGRRELILQVLILNLQ
jgi:hypothetical protein